MRTGTYIVFDEALIGATTKYTNTEFNATLGAADFVTVQALTTNVAGGSPVLTIQSEYSVDGQTWLSLATAEVTASPPVDGSSYVGTTGWGYIGPANLRYKVTLAGTSPECRLKLYATCRAVTGDEPRGGRNA